MLAPVTEADFGEEDLIALNLASLARWPAFAADLQRASGIDCGYRESGALTVAVDRDEDELLRRLHEYQRSLGLDAQWLSARECRRLEPGLAPRVAGGILARARPSGLAAPARARAGPRARGRGRRAAHGCARRARGAPRRRPLGRAGRRASRSPPPAWSSRPGAESAGLDGIPEHARVPVRPVKGQILRLRARPAGDAARAPRDPHSRGVRGAARRRRAGGGSDGGGARLRPLRHRGRRARAAAPRLRGAAGDRRAGAGRDRRRAAARHARQRADRGRERVSRACGGRRATGATGSCSRR